MRNYIVDVDRENDAWLAYVRDVPGAHTFARNMTALDKAVAEVIRLVEDLDEGEPIDWKYDFRNVDPDVKAGALEAEARDDAERDLFVKRMTVATRIASLTAKGYSVRDVAGIVKVSPGRVSQVLAGKADALN